MRMQHSFELPEDFEQTWSLLDQLDEIAPCLPGAAATKIDDDHFAGNVRVRMGPLDMTFKGTIEFVERDKNAGRIVFRSKGSETRGQGTASATTIANLTKQERGTQVDLDTDLMIAGRVAQMGRGMIVEISNDLLERFVSNLKIQRLAASAAVTEMPGAVPDRIPLSENKNNDQYLSGGAIFWRVLKRKLLGLFGLRSSSDPTNRP